MQRLVRPPYGGIGSSDPKRTTSQELWDDDIVSTAWKHADAGEAAGKGLANLVEDIGIWSFF